MRQGGWHKYKAQKTEVDGLKFDSKREAKRYMELKLLERAGKIRDLELQPKFKFEINGVPVLIRSDHFKNGRQASYKADFRYFDIERGRVVIEDSKSSATRTEAYALRRALVECLWPEIRVEEV